MGRSSQIYAFPVLHSGEGVDNRRRARSTTSQNHHPPFRVSVNAPPLAVLSMRLSLFFCLVGKFGLPSGSISARSRLAPALRIAGTGQTLAWIPSDGNNANRSKINDLLCTNGICIRQPATFLQSDTGEASFCKKLHRILNRHHATFLGLSLYLLVSPWYGFSGVYFMESREAWPWYSSASTNLREISSPRSWLISRSSQSRAGTMPCCCPLLHAGIRLQCGQTSIVL